MSRPWFVWLSAFSFMIYALHAPLVAYLIDPVFHLVNNLPGYRMLTFVFLPLSVIALAIGTGAMLRRFIPGFYSILTGGRGL
jgi:membrane-bound acyltransferase YfiQ involved in biofilm formation